MPVPNDTPLSLLLPPDLLTAVKAVSVAVDRTPDEIVAGAWEAAKSELHIFSRAPGTGQVLECPATRLPPWLRYDLALAEEPAPRQDGPLAPLRVVLDPRVSAELDALATHAHLSPAELLLRALALTAPALDALAAPAAAALDDGAAAAPSAWWRFWRR